METDGLAKRLGVMHIVLWGQFALLVALIFVGAGPRTFTDQIAWWVGLGLTAGREPDGHVLVLHLACTMLLGLVLWMMHVGHPWLRRALWATAISAVFIVPVAGVHVPLLIWLARRPDLYPALEQMPDIAGRARAAILTVWAAASLLVIIASVPTFVLVQANPLAWPLALAAATLPHYGALYVFMRQRAPTRSEAAMPRLPDMQTGKS